MIRTKNLLPEIPDFVLSLLFIKIMIEEQSRDFLAVSFWCWSSCKSQIWAIFNHSRDWAKFQFDHDSSHWIPRSCDVPISVRFLSHAKSDRLTPRVCRHCPGSTTRQQKVLYRSITAKHSNGHKLPRGSNFEVLSPWDAQRRRENGHYR